MRAAENRYSISTVLIFYIYKIRFHHHAFINKPLYLKLPYISVKGVKVTKSRLLSLPVETTLGAL